MNSLTDETREIKAIASALLEPILKNEFYNDAEDYINYEDPDTKQIPRKEEEITKIEDMLRVEKNDILDEITEKLKSEGFTTWDSISKNAMKVRDIIGNEKGEYRRRLWNAIKP